MTVMNLIVFAVALIATYYIAKTVIRMGLMLVANFMNFFALIGTVAVVLFLW